MATHAPDSLAGQWYPRLALAVLALAAVLRVYDLGGPSLWFDEITYALNSRGTIAEVIANTQHNNSSPLALPLVLMLVDATAGLGEFAARLPSAVFGIGSVGVMLLLPRVGVSQTVALAAAALLAIGQMQVYYAQEVREYGLSILVAAWMLMAGLHAGRTGRWIPLAIAGAAAPWLSYGPCFAYLAVLGWLGVYRVLGRFQITWKHLALAAAAFFVAAGLAYAFVARHQLGLGQQWYLAEHYLGASGLNPVVWLAANTGGVLLASLPGLIGVVLGAGLGLVWIVQRLGRPLRLLDEPVIVLAGFLIVGMAAAGVLGIYPYGSPRHSVFLAPFFVLAIAAAATSLLQESPASLRLPAAGVLVGAFAVAGALGLLGVTPGAGLHPILAKVGAVRVYGEYQDGRSLVAFARTQAETPLYAVVGAVPAVNYYGADMAVIRGDISLSGRPGPQAEHVLRAAGGTPILVLASNLQDGELDALIAELRARGATVEQVFAATRAWALQVRPE